MNHKEIARFFAGLTGDIRTATDSKDAKLMIFERFLLDVALNNKDEYTLCFSPKATVQKPPSLFTAGKAAPSTPPPAVKTRHKTMPHTHIESVLSSAMCVIADIVLYAMPLEKEPLLFTLDDFRLFYITKYNKKTYPSGSTIGRMLNALCSNRMLLQAERGRTPRFFFAETFLLYLKGLVPEGNLAIDTSPGWQQHGIPDVRIDMKKEKLAKLWRMVDGMGWLATMYLLWQILCDWMEKDGFQTEGTALHTAKPFILRQFIEDMLMLLHNDREGHHNKVLFNDTKRTIKKTHILLLMPNDRSYLQNPKYFGSN